MDRRRISHRSIITKLIMMNLLILIAVGGVVIVNLLVSRQVGDMLITVIDKDVSRVIKNAELSRNLNKVFAETHLLINTFTEQEDILQTQGSHLVAILRNSIATARETDGVHTALERFNQTLEALLKQCELIIQLSQEIQTIESKLDTMSTTLDETITDLIITYKVEGKKSELSSIKQVSPATLDSHHMLLQVAIQLADSKQAHLRTTTVGENYEEHILTLLDDLISGFTAMSTAGGKFAPLGEQLIEGVLRYKEQIIKLHQAMRKFQARLKDLDNAQSLVITVIKRIDKEIIRTTGRIRGDVAENIQSSGNVTVFFSVIAIAVLGGVGIYTVRITRPILHLTASVAEIAAGKLDTPIDTSDKDEVGRLARSFVHMRDVIQEEMNALAEKNAELVQEISERKRIEEALRESEERYRTLFEQANDGIHLANGNDEIIDVNSRMCEIMGYSREELLTMRIPDLQAPKVRRQAGNVIKSEVALYGNIVFEALNIHRDGTRIPIEVSVSKVKGVEGELFISIVRDITVRKRAEEQLKNQNLLLEKAVQEKQQEMEAMFERLLRQEKLATIGQMAGSIAHELRNPLGAVKQSAFFLKRLYHKQKLDASKPKVKEHLELIEAEIDTSERVISNLLQMTQMKPPRREQTDLRPIIEDAAERCQLPEQIQLTLDLNPAPFLIWADPSQFRQVFINLLTNAVQAIKGDGSIKIRAKRMTKDQFTMIAIENDGADIAPDVLSKVFEPLYTTKATGTGLGLSICKQIIENHNGGISLRSEKGQGTTVTIVLPEKDLQDLEGMKNSGESHEPLKNTLT